MDNRKPEKNYKVGRYEPQELAYIEEHYLDMSDSELEAKLNRPYRGIYLQRKKHNWMKAGDDGYRMTTEALQAKKEEIQGEPDYEKPTVALSLDERRQLFIERFANSGRGMVVNDICNKKEVNFYKNKWCEHLEAFDNLNPAEEETLHQMIMEEIHQWRMETRIKKIREENEKIIQEAVDNGDAAPNLPEFDMNTYRELNASRDRWKSLSKSLNATREQRLKQKGEDNMTFVSICQELAKMEARQVAGKEAALIDYMKNKREKQLRDDGFYIGGDI